MMNAPTRFAFIDEGEALRRLGVDRDTLLAFVEQKRLRAYPGVGKGSFFRSADVEALAVELRAGTEDQIATAAPGAEAAPGRKLFDPAYKVHVRLQADLKWYDLEDADLRAWAREMTSEGYARTRQNIEMVVTKLERMKQLMDEAAAAWRHSHTPRNTPPGQTTEPAPKRERRQLPVLGGTVGTTPAAPAAPTLPRPKRPRRDLPMLGGAQPETGGTE